jgi:hypothetical protein
VLVSWCEILIHVLEVYPSVVPYNFDWVIVLCLDIIIFMYHV